MAMDPGICRPSTVASDARRRQAGRSASNHGDLALTRVLRHLRHHDAAAPAERHAGAGVAVIVDDGFRVERLGAQDEA